MNNILSCQNLNKKYQKFSLNNISFTIPKGSIVGFIGENGAGKTTTIKSLLNLIKIDSGEIKIFGKSYKDDEIFIKEKLGVILDNSFLYESLNAFEVGKTLKHFYKNWDDDLYEKYLKKFNLPKDKNIKDFSTGMLMKLKISTCLSHNPELLILDEPTSGLDPVARSEILDIFQEFIENENHSIFVSSHITSDLESIADYIIFIHEGKIILNEEKDKLIDNYGLVKCTEKEFKQINKEDVLKYKKNKYAYEVLIKNRKTFKKNYDIKVVDKASLDDIMLLYIKGESYE